MRTRFGFCLFSLLALIACVDRRPTPAAQKTPTPNPGFLDIEAGARLRVITPILKSGGYVVHTLASTRQGNSLDLQTTDDYIGYETDYYRTRKKGAGVRIDFQSAEVVKDGKPTSQSRPALQLFQLPPQMIYVRLVYLIRVSATDHNAAIVGADTPEALNAVTLSVQTMPDESCQRRLHTYCSWVPPGVGIQPENRKP